MVVLISFLSAFALIAIGIGIVLVALRAQPPTPAADRVIQVSPSANAASDTVVLPSVSPVAE